MLIGLLDAAVESLARRPLLAEEDDWAQQELLPPILPVSAASQQRLAAVFWSRPVQKSRHMPYAVPFALKRVKKGTQFPTTVLLLARTPPPLSAHAGVRLCRCAASAAHVTCGYACELLCMTDLCIY